MINPSWLQNLDRQAHIESLLHRRADLSEQITTGEINVLDDFYLMAGKRPQSIWVRAMCCLELRINRSLAQGRQQSASERKAEFKGIRVYWRIRKKHAVEMEHMLLSVKAECRVEIPGGWLQ